MVLALFVAVLAFYVYTLQPSLSWGDGARVQREAVTGESFILAELVDVDFAPDPFPFARLGVAAWDHPLYVMLGYTLVRALPGMDALWLVNLLSAVFGAGTVALVGWLAYTSTRSVLATLYASGALAVSHTMWWHSATPEVYTLFTFLLVLCVALYHHYERTGSRRAQAGSAFALGLATATHVLALLALPAALLYLALDERLGLRRGVSLSPRRWLGPGAAFVAGFSPYLIQLVRMLRTFSVGELMGPVVGTTFLSGLLDVSPLDLLASGATFAGYLLFQFLPPGVALGIYGLWKGREDAPPLWGKTIALFTVFALFGIFYRVSDQFAFFLGAYVIFALAIAMGVSRLARHLAGRGRSWLAAALAVTVVVTPLFYGALPRWAHSAGVTDEAIGIPQIGIGVRNGLAFYVNPNKRGDDAAYRFGQETLESLPPDAVVFAQWYTDTDEYLILRYFVTVERLRPDVTIEGWPEEELIAFDANIALRDIEDRVAAGSPVYLASLSERYYQASGLVERYCIVQEKNLYRVYAHPAATGQACEMAVQP